MSYDFGNETKETIWFFDFSHRQNMVLVASKGQKEPGALPVFVLFCPLALWIVLEQRTQLGSNKLSFLRDAESKKGTHWGGADSGAPCSEVILQVYCLMDSQSKLPLQESHPCSASLDHFTKKEKDAPESPLPLLFPVVKMFPLLGTTSKAHLEKQVRLFTLCGSQKE
jgi:hypothetical protein